MTVSDAVECVPARPDAATPFLFLCDHASNAVPASVAGGDLGVPAEDMARHIAWDVGARPVTLDLAARFGAPAVLSRFSRLVIDPNRGEDDPTLVMQLYDRTIIPGNRAVDLVERERRLELFHRPYHAAVGAEIARMRSAGIVPHIVAIHSFTPQLRGKPHRPWHIGLLWDRDDRLFRPLWDSLEGEPGVVVGDNEPYTGQLPGDTMNRHGTAHGLPHVLIELRNDLIADAEGQARWSALLARHLAAII